MLPFRAAALANANANDGSGSGGANEEGRHQPHPEQQLPPQLLLAAEPQLNPDNVLHDAQLAWLEQVQAALTQLPRAPLVDPVLEWQQAVTQDPTLQARCSTVLTDFDCLHYAIVACLHNEPMEVTLQHIANMQAFKEEYKIMDTMEDALETVNAFSLQHPEAMLAVEYLPASRNYLCIYDLSKIYPKQQLQTHVQMRIFMAGNYYIRACRSPNFHSIRDGTTTIIECEGATSQNLNQDISDRVLFEFACNYPTHQKEAYFVNAPMVVLMAFNLWKRHLSPNHRQTLYMDRRMPGLEDGDRVASLFKVPTPETARQRMLHNAANFMQLRLYNRQHLFLPCSESASSLSSMSPSSSMSSTESQTTRPAAEACLLYTSPSPRD